MLAALVIVGCTGAADSPKGGAELGKSSAAVTDEDAGPSPIQCSYCSDHECVPTVEPASAGAWGDPHLTSWDNLRYDFQAVGEFLAAYDAGDPNFVVQVRMVPYGSTVSVVRVVAARVATDRVTMDINAAVPSLRINGVPTPISSGEEIRLPGGGTITGLAQGPFLRTYKVLWPTGEALTTSGAYTLKLALHPSRARTIRGLWGSNDRNPGNDLMTRAGEAIAQPPSFSDLYSRFGHSWRITQEESLFDYDEGKSTATYTDLVFPAATPSMTTEQRTAALGACRAAGSMDEVTLENCVTDVAVTGDTALAATAAASVPPVQAGLVDVTAPTGEVYRIDQGEPGDPAQIGCADGQREGLIDLARFPHVAACLGKWDEAKSLRAPASGASCGDDMGRCAVPADLCAPGWHVCGAAGDPAELRRLSATDCEQAGGGAYMSALSYCASKSASCTYAASQSEPYGCAALGTCAEAVCCGKACAGYGVCVDGVWPGKTHVIADGDGCGAAHARTVGGVLCCDNAAGSTTCNGAALSDENPCTRDSCDPIAGVLHIPVPGQSCSDGNACNGVEVCDPTGACKAGAIPAIDDGNACTTDACDPTSGVSHTPTPTASCSDGNPCNGVETCSAAGICRPGAPPILDDSDACTVDSCNPTTGVTHTPVVYDDGNPCTIDSCNSTSGVTHVHRATGESCSDGDACNGAETCDSSGVCRPGASVVADDGNPCTTDSCDPSTGTVTHTPKPVGTTCADSNPCNGVEVCGSSGTCQPGAPIVLSDDNPCTADSCDPTTGIRHTPVGGCVGETAAIVAGGSHTCELKPDGTPVCWGNNASGQATPPAGETFVQIVAGQDHTCGMRAGGTIRCWGSNSWGQLDVPTTETFLQVSAGNAETCAVKTDGTVRCYGYASTSVPPSTQVIASISAGSGINCGIKPDGSVACWGSISGTPATGTYGQLSLAWTTACALRSDGVAVCWGNNGYGQATPPSGATFTQLSTSQNVTCGITTVGALQCWGYAGNGQLATPTGTFTRVSVGNAHACAVRSDGAIICWGSNASGQAPALITPVNLQSGTVEVAYAYTMSFGPPYSSSTPSYTVSSGSLPPGLTLGTTGVLSGTPATAGTYEFVVTYSDGTGFLASQPYAIVIRDKLPDGLSCTSSSQCTSGKCRSEVCCSGVDCLSITAGGTHTCQLRADGTAACWGNNGSGQATVPAGEVFVALTAGQDHTCGLRANGTVRCWGASGWGQLNVPATETYVQVSAGNAETCGVRADGTMRCFGYGAGNVPPSSQLYSSSSAGSGANCALRPDGLPACFGAISGTPTTGTYDQITSAWTTACALRSDGVAVCWGNNGYGQATPPSGVTFTQLSTSQNVTCGITTAGAVRCWGYAGDGQLAVPSGTFTRVSVGNTHACAVRADGAMICWGNNANGQAPSLITPLNLQSGTIGVAYTYAMSFGPPYSSTTASYAVSSGSLPPGLSLSSGGVLSGTPTTAGTFSFAVSYSDGTGFLASQPYAIIVRDKLADGLSCTSSSQCTSGKCRSEVCCSGADCLSITAGGTHTCQLKADGTAACWGNNGSGQATVPAGEVFVALAAGQDHTCGLRANGTVRCWGASGWGQLNVPATETYVQVSAGNAETCGVRADGTMRCFGYGAGNVPPSSQLYSSSSAGSGANCALRPDGLPACWGAISGTPTTGTYDQITSAWTTACALRSDGVAVCWGNNGYGQATPPSGVMFTQLSTSQNVTCGITTAGAVRCWGYAGDGQLAVPSGTFTRVSVGNTHACAVRADGAMICWGNNANGQAPSLITPLNLQSATVDVAYWYQMAFGPPYTSTSASYSVTGGTLPPGLSLAASTGVLSGTPTTAGTYDFTISYSDGTGFVASQPYSIIVRNTLADGRFCTGSSQCTSGTCRSQVCCSGSDCLSVVVGGTHSCRLASDGTAVCWGNNASGQTSVPAGETFVALTAGQDHTCGLRANGTVRCWGASGWGQLNVPATETYVQVSAGNAETCGVRADGTMRCFGYGAGNVPPSSQLYSSSSAGSGANCALRPDGLPACWGAISGTPTTGTYDQITSAWTTACALRSDGVAVCWGNNGYGQATPPSGVTFTQLSTSQNVTCGITTAGALRCWGYAGDGQLAVPSGTFSRVSVGNKHACAVRSDGVVVCWGSNTNGQTAVPG